MRGAAVIAGIGHTAYGKLPGRSTLSMNVEACRAALADAHVDKDLVDGVFVKYPTSTFTTMYGQTLAESLGVLGVPDPVPILGFGQGQTSWEVAQRPVLTSTAAVASARTAFAMAGLGPAQVDTAQLYDCFTIAVLLTLEDYGFCEKGSGGKFVEGGAIELGGVLPVNTSGGLLSETGMPGLQLILEGVRQVRGTAVSQVPGAQTTVISNQGGIMHTHSTLVLGR